MRKSSKEGETNHQSKGPQGVSSPCHGAISNYFLIKRSKLPRISCFSPVDRSCRAELPSKRTPTARCNKVEFATADWRYLPPLWSCSIAKWRDPPRRQQRGGGLNKSRQGTCSGCHQQQPQQTPRWVVGGGCRRREKMRRHGERKDTN